MKKRITLFAFALVFLFSSSGCFSGLYFFSHSDAQPSEWSIPTAPPQESTRDWQFPTPPDDNELQFIDVWESRDQGSASFLTGDVLLISLYIDDPIHIWEKEDVFRTQKFLTTAAEYLTAAAASYGQSLNLIFDAGENADLSYFFTYDNTLRIDGTDSFLLDSQTNSWIATLPLAELIEQYETDNIGFLIFTNLPGVSYSHSYRMTDLSSISFVEKAILYSYDGSAPSTYDDYEGPAVYAHEILHMFGAVDLYTSNAEDGVTEDLVRFIEESIPDEIMLTTYDKTGNIEYDKISSTLSPITAYCLGWEDGTEVLSYFPSLEKAAPAAFPAKIATEDNGFGWLPDSLLPDSLESYQMQQSFLAPIAS